MANGSARRDEAQRPRHLPGRQLRQRVSATTTVDVAPLEPKHQTEILTTMLEKILTFMESTRTIESHLYEEVFITNRDSTEKWKKQGSRKTEKHTRDIMLTIPSFWRIITPWSVARSGHSYV